MYVLEAHPSDGWQIGSNRRDNVIYKQPKTLEERKKVALDCRKCLKVTMPILVDGMDNAAEKAYAAGPVRMYVIGTDGRIGYMGGVGPWGFKPPELKSFLEKLFPPAKANDPKARDAQAPEGEGARRESGA